MIKLSYQFNSIFYCTGTGIRTKIFCLIFLHPPCHHYTRERFIYSYFYKWIRFIIHQHRIVFWSVFFNQITFQNKRFQLGIRHNIFEPGNMCHHLFYLGSLIPAALKILSDTVFKTDCFSDINDRIFFIVHKIYTWFSWQLLQFFLYIKIFHICHLYIFFYYFLTRCL